MTAEELKSELEGLCVEWQKVLRIQDWVVRIQVSYSSGVCGSCTPSQNQKTAIIVIAHPDTIDDDLYKDYEQTLVHELLHLHGSGFDDSIKADSPEYVALEQMIDLTACALVSLKRSK